MRVKLRHLDEWNQRRQRAAALYLQRLGNPTEGRSGELVLPRVEEDTEPVWHVFVIRHTERDRVQRRLMAQGVGTLIHYPVPPHRSKAYSTIDLGRVRLPYLPIADSLSESVLSIPIGPHLSTGQIEDVAAMLLETITS